MTISTSKKKKNKNAGMPSAIPSIDSFHADQVDNLTEYNLLKLLTGLKINYSFQHH